MGDEEPAVELEPSPDPPEAVIEPVEPPPVAIEDAGASAEAFFADEDEQRAATKMQAISRGRKSRQSTAASKQAKKEQIKADINAKALEEEAKAATKMQAITRGRNARAQANAISQKKPQPLLPDPPTPVSPEQLPAGGGAGAAPGQPGQRPSKIARPAQAAPVAASPARSGIVMAPGAAGGALSPTESQGGAMGVSMGGFCSEAEYTERMEKLRKMKREQEVRRKKEQEQRALQEEEYQRQLRIEEEMMRERQLEREAEMKAAREAQRARFQEERKFREMKREELRQAAAREEKARVKPLYVRREELAAKKEADEEAARQQIIKANRQKYQPVEFLTSEVALPETAYVTKPEDSHRFVMSKQPQSTISLPPIKQYYRGNARTKVVQELKEQRNQKKANVSMAAKRKERAREYAKLVAELVEVPTQDPARSSSSARPAPVKKSSPSGGPGSGDRGAGAGAAGGAGRKLFGGGKGNKELEQRSAALNKELRKKETALEGKMKGGPSSNSIDPGSKEFDQLLRVRNDLSAVYVGAIKSKVELLEEIHAAAAVAPSPANTA